MVDWRVKVGGWWIGGCRWENVVDWRVKVEDGGTGRLWEDGGLEGEDGRMVD
jgi:hypothetical protein